MEEWFSMVIRQCILYSLPLLITLSSISLLEAYFLGKTEVGRFKLLWKGSLLPFAATLLFGRAVIFALPYPNQQGLTPCLVRFSGHVFLCFIGWLLYTWALSHPPLTGLPPLHHWWAKVLMYLNLCLMALHLLPLPNMLMGELVLSRFSQPLKLVMREKADIFIIALTIVAASPLLDMLLGGAVIFPIYENLASLAE